MIKHIIWELFGVKPGYTRGGGSYMRSVQYQLKTWEPSQDLLENRGKTKKTCDEMANYRALRIQTDFLSAVSETKDRNHPEFSPAPSLFKLQSQNNRLII
jgi:hypothetical protein